MTKVIKEYTKTVLTYREKVCYVLIAALLVLILYYALTIQHAVFNIAEREKLVAENHTYVSEVQELQSELFRLRSKADLSLATSRGFVEPAKTVYITKKSLGRATHIANEL